MVTYRDPRDGYVVTIDEEREPWRARILAGAGWELVETPPSAAEVFAGLDEVAGEVVKTPPSDEPPVPPALVLNENMKTDKALAAPKKKEPKKKK